MDNTRHLETAFCDYGSTEAFELYDVMRGKEKVALKSLEKADAVDDTQAAILDAKNWLPFASEEYLVSADLKDYIVVPVIFMPSDLPNRNGIAFPMSELSKFNADQGRMAYDTWKGKPTQIDHINGDIRAAKGVILSMAYRPVQKCNGRIWKVVGLCGFDRGKDPVLANEILTGKRDAYSMGATVGGYSCSICSTSPSQGGCDHINLQNRTMRVFDTPRGPQLAYFNIKDPIGFELSSVVKPAYSSAQTKYLMRL